MGEGGRGKGRGGGWKRWGEGGVRNGGGGGLRVMQKMLTLMVVMEMQEEGGERGRDEY